MRRRKSGLWPLLRGLLLPLAAVLILVGFSTALDSLDAGRAEENQRQLEETLRRGCLACYAAEGVYPPSLEYLEEHYGIQIDQKRYTVRYTVYGGNLLPDITVLENQP
ncbi:MAG: hypothetical protein HFF50_08630 [Lawsonibacter sp.]|nr:hypothetical protein [Lawsonibacter sp.]